LSLLGRLEDLSLPDIIQIVFLSRRTGVLEIVDGNGRSTILFHHGLIVDATSPAEPDLASHLLAAGAIEAPARAEVDRMREEGASLGTAFLELGVMQQDDLATSIRERITRLVAPLLVSRDGEFNFILSDSASQFELEYDPDSLFREGGISPQHVLGAAEGEKLKPLSGLEESMRAGKALLGSSRHPAEAPPKRVEIPLRPAALRTEAEALEALAPSQPEPPEEADLFDAGAGAEDPGGEPFDLSLLWDEEGEPAEEGSLPPAGERRVEVPASDPLDSFFAPVEESRPQPGPPPRSAPEPVPEDAFVPARTELEPIEVDRLADTVVLYEPDPLLRVAARRAFTKKGFEFLQFGNLADTREAAGDLLDRERYFVTFLDLVGTDAGSDSPELLLETIKSHDSSLPVVVIDREADLRRRHELLAMGADFYLTKPSPAHLQPGFAEETLGLFSDELMMFAERAFTARRRAVGGETPAVAAEIGALSARDRSERGFALLRRLISELTDPDDLGQLAQTILRMAEGYLDRAVLFAVSPSAAEALAGFGETGAGDEMEQRVRRITIPRSEASVLGDVIRSGAPHRGKLRRAPANEELLRALGALLPTEVAVLPIAHREAVVGLLYGDNARTKRPLQDLSGLEVFLSQAGLALENALSANARSHGTT
jgi:CheY-like chemotaxis protein